MRILLISAHYPYDLHQSVSGTYKRLGTFINALKQIGSLDILFFTSRDEPFTESETKDLEKKFSAHWDCDINLSICLEENFKEDSVINQWISHTRGIFDYYKQQGKFQYCGKTQIDAVRKCLERKPDAIFAHRIGPMSAVMHITDTVLPPIFFDLDDIEHVFLKRYIQTSKKIKTKFLKLQLPVLTRGEYRAVKAAEKTFVCSNNDQEYLTHKFRLPGITAIPNSINVPELKALTREPNLLYLATGGYWPNMQAAEYLINDIWPIVRNELPEARLIVAGKYEKGINIKHDNVPGVELPGFVDDLDSLYERVRATAVPLLIGGGTRFKIIEAAMYGKPTISTQIGAEGIDFTDKTEILIEDNTESFASACIKLLKDYDLSLNMGLTAREKAVKLYDSQSVEETIKEEILEVFR